MSPGVFKRERERIGLSQVKLAKRIGVDRGTIIRWEKGTVPIPGPIAVLMRLLQPDEQKGGETTKR